MRLEVRRLPFLTVPVEFAKHHLEGLRTFLTNGSLEGIRLVSLEETTGSHATVQVKHMNRQRGEDGTPLEPPIWGGPEFAHQTELTQINGKWKAVVAKSPPGFLGMPIGDPREAAKIWLGMPPDIYQIEAVRRQISPEALRMIEALQARAPK